VKEVPRSEVSTEEVKAYLRPMLAEQTKELEMLLGGSFPEWRF
jgi:hypothetical protein